jgi:predicted nucleic acid-binding protein
MNGKAFLDTNIIVYAFDHASPKKAKIAQELIAAGVAEKQSVISYQVVQEFINVALRGFRVSIQTLDLESFLMKALFPMTVVPWTPSLTIQALRLQATHPMSWYDSLIVGAALQSGCKLLYSEDLQHGQRFGALTVENPFV